MQKKNWNPLFGDRKDIQFIIKNNHHTYMQRSGNICYIGNYNFGYTGRFQFWGDVYLISDSKIKKIEETDFYGI
jgi:hypothetical protein